MNKTRKVSIAVFAIYMFLLTWLVLFKFAMSIEQIPHMRNINLIPFAASVITNGKLEVSELVYNILVFVPLGAYLMIFLPETRVWKKILMGAGVSLIFEAAQYIFAIGGSDITDLINNTIGVIAGILFLTGFRKIAKEKTVFIINTMGAIIEIMGIILLAVLFLAN